MHTIDQLELNNALYNIPFVLQLEGFLNIDTLQLALNQLIERHESLRTIFKEEGGRPFQVVIEDLKLELPLEDISHLNENEKSIAAKKCIQKEILAPFTLEDGPLIRFSVIKLNDNSHIFALIIHHSVADGWSMGIINEELSEFYNAILENRAPTLPPLPVQYTDFSIWQREYLKEEGEIYKKLLSYWKDQLSGVPTLLKLPTDYPRPFVRNYQGRHRKFLLSSSLTKKLKELSEKFQGTIFMTLLAAFYTLLYRYTEQEDIIIGSPIANRNRQEIEYLIGFFVNTLALGANISPNLSFKDLLLQVKQKTLEAYDHQDLPFEKLVDHLEVSRSLSYEPLFQVMFVLQNAAENKELKLKELKIKEYPFEYPIAKFDLTLSLTEKDGQLQGFFGYATDLFKESTIERMYEHFHNLLEEIVENPNKPLSKLEMLTPKEKQQFFVTWNDTKTEYPKEKLIHQLFEEQVAKTPENISVIFEDQYLTYQNLNNKANQLAHYLRKRGIGPNTLVAIAYERSLETIIGILGILKAGGAYVPIDPNFPDGRIKYILEDINADLILIHTIQTEKFITLAPKSRILVLEKVLMQTDLKNQPIANVKSEITSNDPAYVIYTSGSTGIPKGVSLPHKTITNLIHWQSNYKRRAISSVSHFSSFSFDVSIQELAYALLSGYTLHLASQAQKENFPDFINLVIKNKINVVFLPSALLELFCKEALYSPDLTSLLEIIVAGEALKITSDIRKFFDKHPHIVLSNHYGPTETHVVSSFELHSPTEKWSMFPPIGRPIWNTRLFILDSNLQPVPVGIPGILHIDGAGLAREYLHQPILTTEKFIENPFASKEEIIQNRNLRLYKTGDVCRWLEDGNIEYIRRNDLQVKIRGYRIELGEIDNVLSNLKKIKQCIVLAKNQKNLAGDMKNHLYLVAYYTSDHKLDESEIRQYLQEKLPDYMMPSSFVYLEKFPLTSNGKVNKEALPDPEFVSQAVYVPPRNALEEKLCQCWAEVLGLPAVNIGIRDDFFNIGGNSFLSIQLISNIRQNLKLDINVKDIFNYKTIEKIYDNVLCKRIEKREDAIMRSTARNIEEYVMNDFDDYDPYIILNDTMLTNNGIIFMFPPAQSGAESYLGNIAPILSAHGRKLVLFNNYYSYLLKKLSKKQLNHLTIEKLASDYISSIKTLQASGPYSLFGWSFGGVLAFEVGRQLIGLGDDVANIILIDSFSRSQNRRPTINSKFPGKNDYDTPFFSSHIMIGKFKHTNIVLFKALKNSSVNDMIHNQKHLLKEDIYKTVKLIKSYVTKYNINELLEHVPFKINTMDCDHFSWLNDKSELEKICKALLNINKLSHSYEKKSDVIPTTV